VDVEEVVMFANGRPRQPRHRSRLLLRQAR
jgi:hypothetical protein